MSCCGSRAPERAHYVASGECKAGAELASIIVRCDLTKEQLQREESHLEIQSLVVGPCLRAGLHVKGFWGVPTLDGSKSIYLQISAPNERLLLEAERTKMSLLLDPTNLAEADVVENQRLVEEEGFTFDTTGGDSEHVDLHIPTVPVGFCSCGCITGEVEDPYSRIYAPFVPTPAKVRKLYALQTSTAFILNEVQALKLLLSIIVSRPETENGAGLNLDHLQVKGRIKRWFPGHTESGRNRLKENWRGCSLPWNLPLGKIREYLGEKVAFYFGFLSHTTKWMIVPAIAGLAVFVHQLILGGLNTVYLPAYGILVAIWSSFFMEFWFRESNKLAQKFGTTDFQTSEPLRPEYTLKAKRVRSYENGKPTFFVDPTLHTVKKTVTGSVTFTLLGAAIVIIGSIFWVRVLLINATKSKGGNLPNDAPDYLTSVINAVVIQVMNVLYSLLAKAFTNFENHATKSSYDNALTLKLAVFTAINSYFPLLYVAAVKNSITINGQPQKCALNALGEPDCLNELRIQLFILIASKIGMSIFLTFLLPIILRWLSFRCLKCRNSSKPENLAAYNSWKKALKVSHYEMESELPPYDPYDDYLEILLLFGYSTLFVVALPIAPLIVLMAMALNVYVDRDRINRLSSRPMPEPANGIGSWSWVFEAASYLSVITNLTVTVFTNTGPVFGQDWSYQTRMIFFIIAEHCVLILKWAISRYISDTDFMTTLQLARQKYLVNKHVFGVKDLVITKAEAEATGQATSAASDSDADGSTSGGADVERPDSSMRNKIRFAKSWFAMSGVADPRGPEAGGAAPGVAGNAFRDASGATTVVPTKTLVAASPASSTASASSSAISDPSMGGGVQMVPLSAVATGAVPVPLPGSSAGGYDAYGNPLPPGVAGASVYGQMPVPGSYGEAYPPATGPGGYGGGGSGV